MGDNQAARLAHDAHGHSHHHSHQHMHVDADTDRRRLITALILIVGFMAAEVIAGLLVHSLALLADAAHMLTDAGALAMSLVVLRLVARPPGGNLTFGYKRSEILSAQVNGAALLVLALLIVYEGITRLVTPLNTGGTAMLVVALCGVVVNLLATAQVARANRSSLNIRGSYTHLVTDLVAFVATAIAGGVIILTGFARADGIASLFVAVIMLRAAWMLLRDSGRVILEAAPVGMSVPAIGEMLVQHESVVSVHDLHVWELGAGFPALSAHVLVHQSDDCHATRRELEVQLHERFGLDHTTLQVDHEAVPELLNIQRRTSEPPSAP